MANSNSGEKGKNIWSRITVKQFVAAVASLGDRVNRLKGETWRLNDTTRSSHSLWGEVIDNLKLDHSELTRLALYKIWHCDRHGVLSLVENMTGSIRQSRNDEDDGHISVPNEINSVLLPDPSLPLPRRPVTRAHLEEDADNNSDKKSFVGEISIVFSVSEWKSVFSRTSQKMKDDWTKTFSVKLTLPGTGIKCSLKFTTPSFKKGKRKRNCRDFACTVLCTIRGCKRKYIIECQTFPDENSSVLFLVRIFGKEDHTNGPGSRQLTGKERLEVGKNFVRFAMKNFTNEKIYF
jgi:hypothetical protein